MNVEPRVPRHRPSLFATLAPGVLTLICSLALACEAAFGPECADSEGPVWPALAFGFGLCAAPFGLVKAGLYLRHHRKRIGWLERSWALASLAMCGTWSVPPALDSPLNRVPPNGSMRSARLNTVMAQAKALAKPGLGLGLCGGRLYRTDQLAKGFEDFVPVVAVLDEVAGR